MINLAVNTDGVSGDYATLSAAIASLSGGLIDDVTINYNTDAGPDTTVCEINITLNGYTLTIQNSGSDRRARREVASAYASALTVITETTIIGVSCKSSHEYGDGFSVSSSASVFRNCDFHNCGRYGINDKGAGNIYINPTVYANGSIGVNKASQGGALYIYNPTVCGNGSYGIYCGAYREVYLKNGYIGGNAGADLFGDTGANIYITTSLTSDGSLSTSTVAYSVSSGGFFTNITAGTEDFHIGSTSSLRGVGTDLSADATYPFDYDYDNDTRSAWDIGADEYIAAGGLSIPVAMNHYRSMR